MDGNCVVEDILRERFILVAEKLEPQKCWWMQFDGK